MRLYEVVEPEEDPALVARVILTSCKPYLLESKFAETGATLKRGTFGKKNVEVKTVRTDRKPRDSAPWQHGLYTEILRRAGATANRHNSLFCTSNWMTAETFGSVHVIFPMGNIHYTYLDHVKDLTESFPGVIILPEYNKIAREEFEQAERDAADKPGVAYALSTARHRINMEWYNKPFVANQWDWNAIDRDITDLVIHDAHLPVALAHGWELMISCQHYIQISQQYYNTYVKPELNNLL